MFCFECVRLLPVGVLVSVWVLMLFILFVYGEPRFLFPFLPDKSARSGRHALWQCSHPPFGSKDRLGPGFLCGCLGGVNHVYGKKFPLSTNKIRESVKSVQE